MKKLLLKALTLVVAIFCFLPAHSQYSRSQAISLVMNQVLVADTGDINLYASYYTILDSEGVELLGDSLLTCPYDSSWVFLSDDHPELNWGHPCRYVFVDALNGNYQITNTYMFPIDLLTDYELIKEYEWPSFTNDTTFNSFSSPETPDINPHLYAVLVVGIESYQFPSKFLQDLSALYTSLVWEGYDEDHIFVLYTHTLNPNYSVGANLNGDNNTQDIDFLATKDTILLTFSNLAGNNSIQSIPRLEPDDQLFVCFISHGGVTSQNLSSFIAVMNNSATGWDELWDYELADAVEDIACAQMIFLFHPCYSGGFRDDLANFTLYNPLCKNRIIHTDNDFEYSWTEMWMTSVWDDGYCTAYGPNYDEFLYYWVAGVRRAFPSFLNNSNLVKPYLNMPHSPGQFPFTEWYPVTHPDDYDPDINQDGIVQMDEAFNYADSLDSWSDDNYFYFPYISGMEEDPQNVKTGCFTEDLLSLAGFSGEVTNTQLIEGNFLFCDELTIKNNATLTVDDDAGLYLNNDASIVVEQGSSLVIGDDVSFVGLGSGNTITCYGQLTIGSGISFENITLINFNNSLSIEDCTFENCGIEHETANFILTGCELTNSYVQVSDPESGQSRYAYITENEFSEYAGDFVIQISEYPVFNIEDNTITGNDADGIQLNYAGGVGDLYAITDNVIGGNGSETEAAVEVYNSTVNISGNYIYGSPYGILSLNGSNIALTGNSQAQSESQTQRVINNTSEQIYATQSSFPYTFHWNVVYSSSAVYPYVEYSSESSSSLDVTYNYWGESYDPEDIFEPHGDFSYLPDWSFGNEKSALTSSAQELFEMAHTYISNNDYQGAEESYKQLINDYPGDKYSYAALKELLYLERIFNEDYAGLKYYYLNDPIILGNEEMNKLAGSLANRCDVFAGNYQEAIYWFEEVIADPPDLEDSIFAIIDLEHTYLLAQNNNKSGYSCKYPQYIPESKKKYEAHKDYLISLLFGADNEDGPATVGHNAKPGMLLQNMPNPFKSKTSITYKLFTPGYVKIILSDINGRKTNKMVNAYKEIGEYSIDIPGHSLKEGLYFYSLEMDGLIIETKKMVLINQGE